MLEKNVKYVLLISSYDPRARTRGEEDDQSESMGPVQEGRFSGYCQVIAMRLNTQMRGYDESHSTLVGGFLKESKRGGDVGYCAYCILLLSQSSPLLTHWPAL